MFFFGTSKMLALAGIQMYKKKELFSLYPVLTRERIRAGAGSIGSMKHRLVRLFTTENPEKILILLQDLFLESLEPIRPGRSAPRIFRNIKKRGKCATVTNYKRVV